MVAQHCTAAIYWTCHQLSWLFSRQVLEDMSWGYQKKALLRRTKCGLMADDWFVCIATYECPFTGVSAHSNSFNIRPYSFLTRYLELISSGVVLLTWTNIGSGWRLILYVKSYILCIPSRMPLVLVSPARYCKRWDLLGILWAGKLKRPCVHQYETQSWH